MTFIAAVWALVFQFVALISANIHRKFLKTYHFTSSPFYLLFNIFSKMFPLCVFINSLCTYQRKRIQSDTAKNNAHNFPNIMTVTWKLPLLTKLRKQRCQHLFLNRYIHIFIYLFFGATGLVSLKAILLNIINLVKNKMSFSYQTKIYKMHKDKIKCCAFQDVPQSRPFLCKYVQLVQQQHLCCVCALLKKLLPVENLSCECGGAQFCPRCARSHLTPPLAAPRRGPWLLWKPRLRRKLGLPPPSFETGV